MTADPDSAPTLAQPEHLRKLAGHLDSIGEKHCAEALRSAAEALERAEQEISRRKGDPVTRLHNICEAVEDPGPFSQEAWDQLEAENSRLLAALNDYVNHLLVERPTSGLMAGKLTLWFLPGGDPSAEPSATHHPRYALSVESNSLDSASLGAIEAYQKAARAALTGAPDER